MKKILIPVILGATVLALASCDSGEEPQTSEEVTIVDENGTEQTVTLTQSEDETVVNNAISYSLAADYESAEANGIQVDVNCSLDSDYNEAYASFTYSESSSQKFTMSANGSLKAKNNVYYAEGNFSVNTEASSSSSNGETKTDENSVSTTSASGHAYADLANMETDPYSYVDYTYSQSDTTDGETEKKSQSNNYKVSYEYIETSISSMLEQYGSDYSELLPSTDSTEIYDASTIFTEIDALLEEMPNSKLVVSSVTKDVYTISLKLSLTDYMALENGITSTEINSEDDTFYSADFSFYVETGLFKGFSLNMDMTSYTNQKNQAIIAYYVSQGRYTSASYNCDADKISVSIDVKYGDVEVPTLAESAKANYTDPTVAAE